MIYFGLFVLVVIAFLLYMWKVAHENNVLHHQLLLKGEQEKIRLFLFRIHIYAKLIAK